MDADYKEQEEWEEGQGHFVTIWAKIWRRSHWRQKCRSNGLIKLINQLIYLKRLANLLYGSVASLPSPSSNIEAWPYGTSLSFASLLHLGH